MDIAIVDKVRRLVNDFKLCLKEDTVMQVHIQTKRYTLVGDTNIILNLKFER